MSYNFNIFAVAFSTLLFRIENVEDLLLEKRLRIGGACQFIEGDDSAFLGHIFVVVVKVKNSVCFALENILAKRKHFFKLGLVPLLTMRITLDLRNGSDWLETQCQNTIVRF
jgi:hypothetical protein